MKIIDIIKQSAELLGLNREIKQLNEITEENESELLKNEEISTLFNLIKYSIQELCTNYIPLVASVTITTEDLKYELNKLNNLIRIQGITKNNEPVAYKIYNRSLNFSEEGEYTIHYETYPVINSLFEDLDYLSSLSPDVIVLGLSSYYSLARGRFEEFETLHEDYIERAESIKELKSFTMPQRRWE